MAVLEELINKTQMLKGILEGCVLKILNEKSCYSQELVQTLRERGFENISEGTLFPLLLRLENEGLFETKKVQSSLGPNRKYYSLSSKGKDELAEFIGVWNEFKLTVDHILRTTGD
ncbi:PadR family transcriptional regulator [Paenibacillus sp. IITD108]|uniref:PadR family transcriptional regulator n=1 Tax=Paenibacillus sp. IITD108 TaxID=3116649 RepID=UPI002F42D2E5